MARKPTKKAVRQSSVPALGPATVVHAAESACTLTGDNATGEYWRWCPRCGHELHNEKCKLRCERCHYFMSCSDFD